MSVSKSTHNLCVFSILCLLELLTLKSFSKFSPVLAYVHLPEALMNEEEVEVAAAC